MSHHSQFFYGAIYLYHGFRDLFRPRIKRFLIIPLSINILIFGLLFYFGAYNIWHKMNILTSFSLPNWLHWLTSIISAFKILLMTIILAIVLSIFGMISTLLANLIAAPFNGMLSDRLSRQLNHNPPPSPQIIHTIIREIRKFAYYVPRALIVGIITIVFHFIPPLNLISPVIIYVFAAWMMAIQYIDYPADNFHIPLPTLLASLRQQRGLGLGFGLMVAILSSIPVLNLFVMPAAVLGATRIWHDHLQGLAPVP